MNVNSIDVDYVRACVRACVRVCACVRACIRLCVRVCPLSTLQLFSSTTVKNSLRFVFVFLSWWRICFHIFPLRIK